jgi:pimeloyl-ACP methyl ester carboxylesterase
MSASRLHVVTQGPSNALLPIVFLHSAAGNASHFAAQQAHLDKTRRTVALDWPGHGQSPRASAFEIPAVAQDVANALDQLAIDRCIVVGHSWGGAVAVALAAQRRHGVRGLLLLDPASDGRAMPKPMADGLMASLEQSYEQVATGYYASLLDGAQPEVKAKVLRDLAATSAESVKGALGSLLRFDPVTPLKALTLKKRTLITRFNDVPHAYQRLVPELETRRIDNTGHWLQLDAADAVNAEIDTFLAP